MKLFLDTSALLKLYDFEAESPEMDAIFSENHVEKVYLSKLSKLEFESAIRKKVRTKHLTQAEADQISTLFLSDLAQYEWVEIDTKVLDKAFELLQKYAHEGLRSLDSIQLSSAVLVKEEVDLNKTFDKLLEKLFEKEGLKT